MCAAKRVRAPAQEHAKFGLEQTEEAMAALASEGFCIFRDVVSVDELQNMENEFWKWARLGGVGRTPDRMSSARWNQLGFPKTGVMTNHSIGQSDFLWSVRLHPNVRRIFQSMWNNDDLITSFDGCGAFRNPRLCSEGPPASWLTEGGWYHVDQNGFRNPDFVMWQGLLNFLPTSAATGGIVVVPRSHFKFHKIFQDEKRHRNPHQDLVKLDSQLDYEKYCRGAEQVLLNPGDFFVWDSRLIHCNQGVDATMMDTLGEESLARLVAYVCMIPRDHADQGVLDRRRKAVIDGRTATHRPNSGLESRKSNRCGVADGYKPPGPTSARWQLI